MVLLKLVKQSYMNSCKLMLQPPATTNFFKTKLNVVQESFTAAKLAFTSYKMRVRSNIAISHRGPETLEEAVQDYINRNVDTFDLPGLVAVSAIIIIIKLALKSSMLQLTRPFFVPAFYVL